MEEGRKREGEKRGEEEICGEIIIPGVTVATFCEVDVNKILSDTIHFNFTSKRCCRGSGGCRNEEHCARGKSTHVHTHTHMHTFLSSTARRWLATCAAYRLAGKHIIA